MRIFNLFRTATTGGVSILALVAAATCQAQGTSPASDEVALDVGDGNADADADAGADQGLADTAEIIVSGSRIVRDGSSAPTPVTVISQDQLTSAAPSSLADGLNQLPVFQNSLRPGSTGSTATGARGNGGNYLNLRSLGPARTLVLLDGRRVVSSTAGGSTDVNLFPQMLVSRVDVVTGGASAAYGSDAVAGVVNFVLDDRFQGLKIEGQRGISSRGDGGSYQIGAAYAGSFADDRLHILASIERSETDGINLNYSGRDWAEQGWGIIPNPSGSPAQVFAPDVALSNGASGGLITNSVFAGNRFLADGSLVPFNNGAFRSASAMSGGDGGRARTNLSTGLKSTSLFSRATFDITPRLSIFGEVAASDVKVDYLTSYSNQTGSNAYTIFADNAFLPDAVKTRMANEDIASFTMGRFNDDWAPLTVDAKNKTLMLTAGFKGRWFADWEFKGYYTHSSVDSFTTQHNNPIMMNVYRAADAVAGPNGTVVCRSTLANPGDGCVPIDLFGFGSPSPEALAYVTGDTWSDLDLKQDIFSFETHGDLLSLPAGAIRLAIGLEHRREAAKQVVDPISTTTITASGIRGLPTSLVGQAGGFWLTNPKPIDGKFDVTEGFAEIDAPLLSGKPLAESLTLNAAIRYADYSTAGGATTWKAGAVYSPVDGLRFRVTRSRDIRAPNIAELFTSSLMALRQNVRDPQRNGAATAVTRITVGNMALSPEKADTLTAGVVVQPRILPGLTASIDWYRIKIDRAITTPNIQDVVDGCYTGGATALCDFVVRDNAGVITQVTTPTLNLAQFKASGVDAEISYRTDFVGGELTLRGLASWVDEFETVNGSLQVDRTGVVGLDTGVPKWRGLVSANWRKGPFRLFVSERWIDGGVYDNTLTAAALSPEDNSISDRFYTDMTVSVDFGKKEEGTAFLTVNNLFDKDPPIAPSGSVTTPRATNGYLYDMIGRYFTAGVKLRF
jgi:outer membrane receptor protein involved in Fe transport